MAPDAKTIASWEKKERHIEQLQAHLGVHPRDKNAKGVLRGKKAKLASEKACFGTDEEKMSQRKVHQLNRKKARSRQRTLRRQRQKNKERLAAQRPSPIPMSPIPISPIPMSPTPISPISIAQQAEDREGEEYLDFEDVFPVEPRSDPERVGNSEVEEGSDTESVIPIEPQPKPLKAPEPRPQKDLERERMIKANQEASRQALMPVFLAREARKKRTLYKSFPQ